MNLTMLLTASASAADQQVDPVASVLTLIVPLGLMVLFFYFFIIRPEKKRTK